MYIVHEKYQEIIHEIWGTKGPEDQVEDVLA